MRAVLPFCVLLGLVGGGCATQPEPAESAHEAWGPPRPLGKEFERYHPPQEPTHASAPEAKVEEPTGVLTLRQVLALALRHNPEAGVGLENFGGSGAVRKFDAAESASGPNTPAPASRLASITAVTGTDLNTSALANGRL